MSPQKLSFIHEHTKIEKFTQKDTKTPQNTTNCNFWKTSATQTILKKNVSAPWNRMRTLLSCSHLFLNWNITCFGKHQLHVHKQYK
jgi:hypothetical protein